MSVVTVQIGQCGNQIGTRMFDLLWQDAHLPPQFTSMDTTENIVYKKEMLDKYFNETKCNQVEARAVLLDMEQKAIMKSKQTAKQSGVWRFSDDAAYHEKRGSANNWALGYNQHGKGSCESIMNICRKQVEGCDHFAGFLILMSVAGGTGSGLGTYVTHALRDHFPEALLVNNIVWPYSSGEVIVQNYNTMLTMSHLQQSSDLILCQQNDQIHDICTKLLSIKNVSFQHVNDVISHKLASVLQPSFTADFHSVDILYDLVQAVASHPSYKLASIKNIPHIGEKSMAYTTYVWPALLKHLRQMLIADSAMEEVYHTKLSVDRPKTVLPASSKNILEGLEHGFKLIVRQPRVNWEMKVPVETSSGSNSGQRLSNFSVVHRETFNKSVSNLLILRGKDLQEADTQAFKLKQLYAGVVPSQFHITEWHQSRPLNQYQKSVALVTNSQSLLRPLNMCVDKAWNMFNARAYLHQYETYGLTDNDFIDSFGAVEQVIADYARL